MFLSLCICGFQPAYVCLVPTYASTSLRVHDASQEPYFKSHFICFLSKCKSNTLFSFFCKLCPPFSGRGSTNCVAVCYRVLTTETRAHIHVAGFETIICLLLERFDSAILVQTLVERWWNTTHTFHIANREMIVIPHDFHCMTSLRCDGALMNL